MSDYELFLFKAQDGLHMALYLPEEEFIAYRVFPHTASLFELLTWVEAPDSFPKETTMRPSTQPGHAVPVSFNQTTGKLEVHTTGLRGKPRAFDPHDDESLASLVRTLKRLAPVDHGQPTLNLPLPKPTKEQFDRRQVFTEVATAQGVGRYSKPRSRYMQPSMPKAEAFAAMSAVLGKLKVPAA